jgi:hypothetical protein
VTSSDLDALLTHIFVTTRSSDRVLSADPRGVVEFLDA